MEQYTTQLSREEVFGVPFVLVSLPDLDAVKQTIQFLSLRFGCKESHEC